MSEKFGLDWKEYDFERISSIIHVISEQNIYEQEQIKKSQPKQSQPQFRPRMK